MYLDSLYVKKSPLAIDSIEFYYVNLRRPSLLMDWIKKCNADILTSGRKFEIEYQGRRLRTPITTYRHIAILILYWHFRENTYWSLARSDIFVTLQSPVLRHMPWHSRGKYSISNRFCLYIRNLVTQKFLEFEAERNVIKIRILISALRFCNKSEITSSRKSSLAEFC